MNFQITDDWTPNMFQAFMHWCWSNNYSCTPANAKYWRNKYHAA